MLLPEPGRAHDGDVLAGIEVDRDAPQGVDGHGRDRRRAAAEQTAAARVPHHVGLGHVDQPDDRLAGRRAQTLVETHCSDPPLTAAGPAAPAAAASDRRHRRRHRRHDRRRSSSSARPPAAIACSACSSVKPPLSSKISFFSSSLPLNNCIRLFARESSPSTAGTARALAPAPLPLGLAFARLARLAGGARPQPPRPSPGDSRGGRLRRGRRIGGLFLRPIAQRRLARRAERVALLFLGHERDRAQRDDVALLQALLDLDELLVGDAQLDLGLLEPVVDLLGDVVLAVELRGSPGPARSARCRAGRPGSRPRRSCPAAAPAAALSIRTLVV